MTDKDVQREIEENQRRARDEQDVGLEEDILEQDRQEGNTTILDDLGDAIFGDKDDSRQQEVEYEDNNTSRRSS